jgi:hypothetical protein
MRVRMVEFFPSLGCIYEPSLDAPAAEDFTSPPLDSIDPSNVPLDPIDFETDYLVSSPTFPSTVPGNTTSPHIDMSSC